jgi:hypothetical protein
MLRILQSSSGPAEPGPQASGPRRIDLSCVPSDGSRRAVASLELSEAGGPAVGYVTESTEGRLRVTGWIPRRQFRQLRDALARGGRLHLFFDLRDQGARVGYLTRIGLTGPHGVLATARAAPPLGRVPARTGHPAPSRFAMPL